MAWKRSDVPLPSPTHSPPGTSANPPRPCPKMASLFRFAVPDLIVMISQGQETGVLDLTPEACYQAGNSRDSRFDGRFFTAVKTTRIYCRPICPAGRPKFENCLYFRSAAAAQDAGFRPCLRCRPEVSPEFTFWNGTSNTVSRAMSLIQENAVDPEATIDQLAERLGVGPRQLRRLFHQYLGASPISVIQTRRVLFAKQLIHETRLPMSEVALASGFGSIRRFNDTFHKLYGRSPSSMRCAFGSADAPDPASAITLQLTYRPPYDWAEILGCLAARAIPGVESIENGRYRRHASVAVSSAVATVEVGHDPDRNALKVTIEVSELGGLTSLIAKVRRVFDLGADPAAIDTHLAKDPLLAPLVARRPGLRTSGAWDGFELAVRAVLGQQVSVASGRTLGGRLVEIAGTASVFPSAAAVAQADLDKLPIPASRRQTLRALAEATAADPKLFERSATLEESVHRLRQISGIGEWTAQYIALRALREPDAFPASDLGLLRAAAKLSGRRLSPAELLSWAEPWRPWRAYAAQHLWTSR
jgi:AraC family transcriptional regulator of adaptative response / DNA-3-methyladenine glycosylase II